MATQPIVPPTPPQARPFGPVWRIALAVAIIAVLALIVALWPFLAALTRALTSAVDSYGAWIALALLLFGAALLLGIVRFVWAWGWKMDASARQARVVRLQNDLPMDVSQLRESFTHHAAWSLRDHYATTLAEAQRATPNLTSQHVHIETHPAPPAQLAAPAAESVSTLAIPTFAQLLDSGQIGTNKPLILAYAADSGQPITGDWNQLYSCGVGGMTGSGKSWVIAFLAGQSAAAGARIILIDPHAGDGESLANRLAGLAPSYMCDVASTPTDIENALKLASSKLDNRRAGRAGNWPILLICDEWTSMLRGKLGDLLTATALDFAEQGRKYGCFGILGAQAWQVDAAGAVRDRLASHYILRTRGDQFRYQTGLRSGSAPEDTLTLKQGEAYLLSTRGELQRVIIPQMTAADILRLGTLVDQPARSPAKFGFIPPTQRLPQPLPAELTGNSLGTQTELTTNVSSSAAASHKQRSPEAARAAALFLEGKEIADIIRELRGELSGRARQQASADIQQLIREGLH